MNDSRKIGDFVSFLLSERGSVSSIFYHLLNSLPSVFASRTIHRRLDAEEKKSIIFPQNHFKKIGSFPSSFFIHFSRAIVSVKLSPCVRRGRHFDGRAFHHSIDFEPFIYRLLSCRTNRRTFSASLFRWIRSFADYLSGFVVPKDTVRRSFASDDTKLPHSTPDGPATASGTVTAAG